MRNCLGLSFAEARLRLEKYGLNELASQKKHRAFEIFIHQFRNFLVYLLFFASLLSFTMGEFIDGAFILLIIILNALLGFVQEYKAENALLALKKMALSEIQVVRDGKDMLINSRFLVPGDIIKLSEGVRIPADCKILESFHLEVNEASLTGESLPVPKSEKDSKNNLLFMGTIVSSGRGIAETNFTGKNTRFGKMASSLTEIAKEKTPLSRKITGLGKALTLAAVVIVVFLFAVGLILQQPLVETVLTSISLAVAAVPEGLPAVITITLAVGLQRMAKKKAILRKLSAIEALGSINLIVTDKTGTLTENRMRITKMWYANQERLADDISAQNLAEADFYPLLKTGIICNNAVLVHPKENAAAEILGDQTEGSLLLLAHDLGLEPEKILGQGKMIDEFSFSPVSKTMSVLWKEHEKEILYAKGAPESILAVSSHFLMNGKAVPLDLQKKSEIESLFSRFADSGLRILALSSKEVKKGEREREKLEKDLVFLGFVGISDPPRKEVPETLKIASQAGIRTIMVTGDNPLTAVNIGRKIGLIKKSSHFLTGKQMQFLSDKKLAEKLKTVSIFARAVPEDKLRIVKLLQKENNIVAVTGDGVNDSLALKQADIGVAMGITGTDVAKEVADMIITDDNFVSIVSAVKEGRIIFANIVKSVSYLVSCNLGEILTIAGAMMINLTVSFVFGSRFLQLPLPLLPIHILWINIVTDGLPALSLAFDPGAKTIMSLRQKKKEILQREDFAFLAISALIMALITLAFFIFALKLTSIAFARAVAFNSLVILQMIMVFVIRGKQSIFSNKLLLFSVFASLFLQFIIFTVPPLPSIFKLR